MGPLRIATVLSLAAALGAPGKPAAANVITDWDATAVAFVQTRMPPPAAYRVMAMVHVAMFDAVNSIEPRYRAYKVQLQAAPDVDRNAAAAAAAGTVLSRLYPESAADHQAALSRSLAAIPDGDAKARGIRLGEDVAGKILEARAHDGAAAPDGYRPNTRPGLYVATAPAIGWQWQNVTPFAMTSPSQFRPQPPVSLASEQWVTDYNEIKSLGARNSGTRSPRQTEDARFWLLTGPLATHPLVRQIIAAKGLSVVDSARVMALAAVAEADACTAVFDAKYKYEFWRPVTAIRNGDTTGNPATERDATWQPIDATPPHPEYPCAHCIISSSVASTLAAVFSTAEIPEVTLTSPTAPGATHRWTNLNAYADEVAGARIYAGFHYRFSTVVGQDMGRRIGAWTVETVMRPVDVSAR